MRNNKTPTMRHGVLAGVILLAFTINAVADVKIVYPFAGATLPNTDPVAGSLSSHYTPFSFSVVCPGGPYEVSWEIDNVVLGQATFYDQYTAQFIQKLEGGGHHFKVETDRRCGLDEIKFIVGN